MSKIDKFYSAKHLFSCPVCGKKIRFHGGSLVCKREHRFDISSKGYVNFLQSSKPLKGYDRLFFESRQRFFAGGYYDEVARAVTQKAIAHLGNVVGEDRTKCVIDAGCGEGFYACSLNRALPQDERETQILAFDLASDAIKTAAKSEEQIKWMVADITNIPVKDQIADCILDVFTPANYKEFKRILAPDGIVIKVIPGRRHMAQLRTAAESLLRRKDYSNEEVLDYFLEHFALVERETVTTTMAIDKAQLENLVHMTPLLFDVDKSKLNLEGLTEITVEAEILIGK
ncbi:MAG: putative RNA methyltransferase [Emergencia sp.]